MERGQDLTTLDFVQTQCNPEQFFAHSVENIGTINRRQWVLGFCVLPTPAAGFCPLSLVTEGPFLRTKSHQSNHQREPLGFTLGVPDADEILKNLENKKFEIPAALKGTTVQPENMDQIVR